MPSYACSKRLDQCENKPLEPLHARKATQPNQGLQTGRPLQSPEMGQLGNTIFGTQKWGAALRAIEILWGYYIPRLLSKSLLKGELDIPGELFKWLQDRPAKSPFLGPENGISQI